MFRNKDNSEDKSEKASKRPKSSRSRILNKRILAILHISFNVILGVLVYMMSVHWELGWLAIALVFLSKWRVVAVRFRFWWANIRTNLPDVVVGVSTVAWLMTSENDVVRIIVALLYIGWLVALKPRDDKLSMIVQAGWSTFIGVNTAMVLGYMQYDILALFLIWIIIWSNTRHFLGIFDDDSTTILAIIWATLATQIAWLCLQWVVLFNLPGDIIISQFVLIMLVMNYGLSGWYQTAQAKKLDTKQLILRYGVFCVIAICMIFVLSPWKGVL